MTDAITDDDIEQVVAEAKKTFTLADRRNSLRTFRTGEVTIYLDEDAGELVGGAKDVINATNFIVDRQRWGIYGEIDLLRANPTDDPEADIQRLGELREALIEPSLALEKSALTYHFRAVPEAIVKKCRREAKSPFRGNDGKVPADKIEDFTDLNDALLLEAIVTKVVDPDGTELDYSLDDAKWDKNNLPRSEIEKLIKKLNEVQFKQAIGDSVTGSASF